MPPVEVNRFTLHDPWFESASVVLRKKLLLRRKLRSKVVLLTGVTPAVGVGTGVASPVREPWSPVAAGLPERAEAGLSKALSLPAPAGRGATPWARA